MDGTLSYLMLIAIVAVLPACQPGAGPSAARAPAAQSAQREAPPTPGPTVEPVQSQTAAAHLKEFELEFRRAILGKDVEWVVAHMNPTGWTCGDAFMPASAYADAFRQGHMDFTLLFDWDPRGGKRTKAAGDISYREWFLTCPDAYAVETSDDPVPDTGSAYLIRWLGTGCPQNGPEMRVIQREPSKIFIRVFGGCL